MPLVNGPSRQPSFEEFIDKSSADKSRAVEKGKQIVEYLNGAQARVDAGIDPVPPYDEQNHIFGKDLEHQVEAVDEDKKEK